VDEAAVLVVCRSPTTAGDGANNPILLAAGGIVPVVLADARLEDEEGWRAGQVLRFGWELAVLTAEMLIGSVSVATCLTTGNLIGCMTTLVLLDEIPEQLMDAVAAGEALNACLCENSGQGCTIMPIPPPPGVDEVAVAFLDQRLLFT